LGGREKKKSQESRNIIYPIALAQSVAAVADCGLLSQNHSYHSARLLVLLDKLLTEWFFAPEKAPGDLRAVFFLLALTSDR
jgi:hypothetical protein